MRQLFSEKTAPRRGPKRILERYKKLSDHDIRGRIAEMDFTITNLGLARFLIESGNKDVNKVISLDIYPFMTGRAGRRTEAFRQELEPGSGVGDTGTMHRNMQILGERQTRLEVLKQELERIAEKDQKRIREKIGELESMDNPGKKRSGAYLGMAAVAAAGLGLLGAGGTTGKTVLLAAGAVAGICAAKSLKGRICSQKESNVPENWQKELDELSRGFELRYSALAASVDETLYFSSRQLDRLIRNLLSQVPDSIKKEARQDIEFFEICCDT
ncbi:hypothetical protein GF318_05600 [Candidatus Micrarchaeota archaeon]|nr:hypothetical protein [Candidatus Micrarchaeota archaeon]